MRKPSYWLKHTVLATLSIFIGMGLLNRIPANLEFLNPVSDALADFELTDVIFSQMQDPSLPPDTNIVLVNIGNLPLGGIAGQLEYILAQQPKVVGMDFRLNKPERDAEQDSLFIAACQKAQCPLIIASKLEGFDDSLNRFERHDLPLPQFRRYLEAGFANLVTENQEALVTCRSFAPSYATAWGQEKAFSIHIAEKMWPKETSRFLARNNALETIYFKRNLHQYYAIDVMDIFTGQVQISLKNKVVLLGFMGDNFAVERWEDKFYTPMNPKYAGKASPDMYGLVIHANIITMIREGVFIDYFSETITLVGSIALSLLVIWLFLYVKEEKDQYYDLITKSIQFAGLIIFTSLELLIFYQLEYKVDFGLILAIMIFSGDAVEVYEGLRPLIRRKLLDKLKPTS